jgi:hypothetical protein
MHERGDSRFTPAFFSDKGDGFSIDCHHTGMKHEIAALKEDVVQANGDDVIPKGDVVNIRYRIDRQRAAVLDLEETDVLPLKVGKLRLADGVNAFGVRFWGKPERSIKVNKYIYRCYAR